VPSGRLDRDVNATQDNGPVPKLEAEMDSELEGELKKEGKKSGVVHTDGGVALQGTVMLADPAADAHFPQHAGA